MSDLQFTPEPPPGDVEQLPEYIFRQLQAIQDAMVLNATYYEPVHIAPTKPPEGMVAFADGTDWNPGAGAGLYEYAGGAWNKL